MEAIVKQAEKLGEAIAGHGRCKALAAAREALAKDEAARQLQEDYDAAAETLQKKKAAGEVLEPEEKRREAELRSRLADSETLAALVRAQADFHELMVAVSKALERAIRL
ncbi:MAG: YlbF family regulator [Planctomycetota bacterium]|jgi:cell fate (sporulation/competence/biofilm development) regulator YlbF (YheA/YmcA/DUF963 family)